MYSYQLEHSIEIVLINSPSCLLNMKKSILLSTLLLNSAVNETIAEQTSQTSFSQVDNRANQFIYLALEDRCKAAPKTENCSHNTNEYHFMMVYYKQNIKHRLCPPSVHI